MGDFFFFFEDPKKTCVSTVTDNPISGDLEPNRLIESPKSHHSRAEVGWPSWSKAPHSSCGLERGVGSNPTSTTLLPGWRLFF